LSVINQMLKDLDQRQVEQEGSTSFTAPASSSSSNKKIIFFSLIIIILLNAVGIFVWQIYAENQKLKISNVQESSHLIKQTEKSIAKVKEYSEPVVKTIEVDNSTNNQKISINNRAVNNKLENAVISHTEQSQIIPELISTKDTTNVNITNDIDTFARPANVSTNNANDQQKNVESQAVAVKKSTLKISRKQLTPHELAKQKLKRAEQALANNDISQAEHLFEDVLLVMPEHNSARKQLAALWFGRQAYSDALNLLSQGIRLSPNDSEFRVMKARVYLQQNQARQAFNTLNYMPRVNEVIDVEYQSIRATTAQQLNEFTFAVEAYQVLVSIEPSAARWWLGLAVALDSNSKFEQATNAYQTALNKTGLSGSAEKFARQRIIELGE
jgi:MSHA biogenesis protein MshN